MTEALKNLKNLEFNGLILMKIYIMFQLKKYRGVTFALKIDTQFERKLACTSKN